MRFPVSASDLRGTERSFDLGTALLDEKCPSSKWANQSSCMIRSGFTGGVNRSWLGAYPYTSKVLPIELNTECATRSYCLGGDMVTPFPS
ncbi:hypothetical protein BYT27DRAFT_7196243 [Phlegmacium glaucopus]|nr:hypothetical protein BYT27DRAFT_7196243 [Phlegmacium glaucopus]